VIAGGRTVDHRRILIAISLLRGQVTENCSLASVMERRRERRKGETLKSLRGAPKKSMSIIPGIKTERRSRFFGKSPKR